MSLKYSALVPARVGEAGPALTPPVPWQPEQVFARASALAPETKAAADNEVLDPHEVEDGWFEIELPSLQLRLTDRVPAELRAKAEFTLRRLHLGDDERIVRQRSEWYRMYLDGELNLDGLRKKAPLIAQAVKRG